MCWERVGWDLGLEKSLTRFDSPSDAVSLEDILISPLSDKLGFFRAREMPFGGLPAEGSPLWCFF